jgi:hypothetical protein
MVFMTAQTTFICISSSVVVSLSSCCCHLRPNVFLSTVLVFVLRQLQPEFSHSKGLKVDNRRFHGSGGLSPVSPRRPGFRVRDSPCRICGEQSGIGTRFSASSVFLCQYHSTMALHTHTWEINNRPVGGRSSVVPPHRHEQQGRQHSRRDCCMQERVERLCKQNASVSLSVRLHWPPRDESLRLPHRSSRQVPVALRN